MLPPLLLTFEDIYPHVRIPYTKYFELCSYKNWSLHNYVSLIIDNYKFSDKDTAHSFFFLTLQNIINGDGDVGDNDGDDATGGDDDDDVIGGDDDDDANGDDNFADNNVLFLLIASFHKPFTFFISAYKKQNQMRNISQ